MRKSRILYSPLNDVNKNSFSILSNLGDDDDNITFATLRDEKNRNPIEVSQKQKKNVALNNIYSIT